MKAKIDKRFRKLKVAMRQNQTDINNLARLMEMNRQAIIKLENESEQRFEALEEWASGADEMLTELNHALPDPEYDAKCEAVADIEASLDRHRERLGLNKSELTGSDLCRKMLDDGATGVDCYVSDTSDYEASKGWFTRTVTGYSDDGFHTDRIFDWCYAVPVPKEKELTGSDLARAMLERGDKVVLCAVSDDGDFVDGDYDAIRDVDEDGLFESHGSFWWHVQPVNNKGEPLTQAEVGL